MQKGRVSIDLKKMKERELARQEEATALLQYNSSSTSHCPNQFPEQSEPTIAFGPPGMSFLPPGSSLALRQAPKAQTASLKQRYSQHQAPSIDDIINSKEIMTRMDDAEHSMEQVEPP